MFNVLWKKIKLKINCGGNWLLNAKKFRIQNSGARSQNSSMGGLQLNCHDTLIWKVHKRPVYCIMA